MVLNKKKHIFAVLEKKKITRNGKPTKKCYIQVDSKNTIIHPLNTKNNVFMVL
jgi:hypothetical protein